MSVATPVRGLFDPLVVPTTGFSVLDHLRGPLPTWHEPEPNPTPIYLELLCEMGVPGQDTPMTPGTVLVGTVVSG